MPGTIVTKSLTLHTDTGEPTMKQTTEAIPESTNDIPQQGPR